MQIVVALFAAIGLGTTGVFTYRWLAGIGESDATPATQPSVASDGFVTDLEFTPEALREAVEEHGVSCDAGWQEDGNGAEICSGEGGQYAVVPEPIERVLDGYVSGGLLDGDPYYYVIGTLDAALVVPGDDIGWLYKVWDDCADCFGWATGGGREVPTVFTGERLRESTDVAVICEWYEHDSWVSTCVYDSDAVGDAQAVVVSNPTSEQLAMLHDSNKTTIHGAYAALQFEKDQAYRFATIPTLRACQITSPCYIQVGDGDVWEFDPVTPEDVDAFFQDRAGY